MRVCTISILILSQLFLSNCQGQASKDTTKTTVEIKKTEESTTDSLINSKSDEISFLFLGDIMGHDLQIESAYNTKTKKYDFSTEFEHIIPLVNDVDATVGNLEVTLAGPPYKGYPKFSSPDQLAVDIKNAGIEYIATANNHINDRGLKGFKRTVSVLDSLGLTHTGTFRSPEEKAKKHPMVINEKGWRVAVFNYTYGVNGGTYSPKMLLNEIDTLVIKKDLMAAEKQKYDAIIVFFHWGQEYKRNSNSKQQKIAKMCFEYGANAVIGAHPHVVQEMKKFRFKDSKGKEKDALVAYSLGNYVANYGSWRYSNGGALLRFKFRKADNGEVKIEEQGHFLVWVYRKKKTEKLKTYYVLPIDLYEHDKTLGSEHIKLMKTFINDSRTHLKKYNKNVNEYRYNKDKKKWEVEWK